MCLEDAARKYLGTPFRHQGRTIYGMDCLGLVLTSLKDSGKFLKDKLTLLTLKSYLPFVIP